LKSVSGAIEALKTLDIDQTLRAENLSLSQFIAIARELGPSGVHKHGAV
jgi:16S rRNA A1518/A1519 N6-dimethyltransferase RsmA/KsgA/DIM1 with predicted DNA glycosylase/AP lyase activity